jgi:UDP-glucose 4-epimerase
MKILIVGGAGYIGSHMAKMLVLANHDVTILDNLSTGYEFLAKYGELIIGDLSDEALLDDLFKKNQFDAVMHFAAVSLVGESVKNPSKYYRNNVTNTLFLLDVMRKFNVNKFIFSSSAATFGEPKYSPIDELHPQRPINPYGYSKLIVETILRDYAEAYGLNSVSLRYFNACGADPDVELGESHDPESHLIPLALQAASGRRKSITVFGNDYDTNDGTCVRDYIHVNDLCHAHALSLNKLMTTENSGALTYNLGNGHGFSVNEVITAVKRIVEKDGCNLIVNYGNRRSGDPSILVADATKINDELGWKPMYSKIDDIINHAWAWEQKLAGKFL